MKTILVTVGLPACGKSTYAKELLKKEPGKWKRFNKDLLREMFDNSVWNKDNEEFLDNQMYSLMRAALKKNYNCIMDNTNFSSRVYKRICEIAKQVGDVTVMEKVFDVPVEECIKRDSLREGVAKVGESVIRGMYDRYKLRYGYPKPKTDYFEPVVVAQGNVNTIIQDETLPKCVVFDNDGTISNLCGRDPYNALHCDEDLPNEHVVEVCKLYYNAGYKILFVSGREDKYKEPTERFYQKYLPGIEYELYMRPTDNFAKDVIIKENIYKNHIEGRYFVSAWFDDRLQICKWLYEIGMPLFRVGDPEANF